MVMDMESQIEKQINGKSPSKVSHLNLEDIKTKDISGDFSKFIKLQSISFKGTGLTSLQGLQKLPVLTTLNLDGNQLDGKDLDRLLELTPKLEVLNLSHNPLTDISSLAPLAKLENLSVLELTGTGIAKGEDYHQKVMELLPNLKVLDNKTRDGTTIEDDDDESEDEEDGDSGSDDEDNGPGLAQLLGEDALDDDEEDFNEESNDDEEDEDDDEDDEDGDDDEGTPVKSADKTGTKRKQREDDDEE